MSKRLLWPVVSACLISAVTVQSVAAAEPDTKSLEKRLQAVEDRLAIEDLVAGQYSMALDSGDPQGYANVFTEDAFLSVAGRPFHDEEVLAVAAALDRAFGSAPPPLALT